MVYTTAMQKPNELSDLILAQLQELARLLAPSGAVCDIMIHPVPFDSSKTSFEILGWGITQVMFGRGVGQSARFALQDDQFVCSWG